MWTDLPTNIHKSEQESDVEIPEYLNKKKSLLQVHKHKKGQFSVCVT